MNHYDTIKQAMLAYPSIFSTTQEIDHQLFFVTGNGYRWCKGELVSNDPPMSMMQAIIKANAHFDSHIENFKIKNIPAAVFAAERQKHNYWFVSANIDDIIEFSASKSINVYPWSEYAKILNIPDDITDDWLKAAYEHVKDLRLYILDSDDDRKQSYQEKLPALIEKLDDALIARGIHASREARLESILKNLFNPVN
jgi:hypothetical protein